MNASIAIDLAETATSACGNTGSWHRRYEVIRNGLPHPGYRTYADELPFGQGCIDLGIPGRKLVRKADPSVCNYTSVQTLPIAIREQFNIKVVGGVWITIVLDYATLAFVGVSAVNAGNLGKLTKHRVIGATGDRAYDRRLNAP